MMLARIAQVVAGSLHGSAGEMRVTGVSTDTRTIHAGDLFVALRGPNHDGHAFVPEAFARGAAGAMAERPIAGAGAQIIVKDALEALGTLAGAARMTHPARFISVSGSNGKTTTKDMIAHILSKRRRVVRAPASFNNAVGVPRTIFTAKVGTEFVILELGTSRPGDMAALGRIARPDAAVITSIGEEHLEALGSLEGVATEEAAILEYVRAGGMVIAPAECGPLRAHLERIPREKLVLFGTGPSAEWRAERVAATPGGTRFHVLGVPFELALLGPWNVTNALAASAAAMAFGMELSECAEALRDFRAPKMRMEVLTLGGIEILNDAYNSNPASAFLAVEEFGRRSVNGRKIAVIGDMRELGAESERRHRELGRVLARQRSIGAVLLVGAHARAAKDALRPDQSCAVFDTVEAARDEVIEWVQPGDGVMLKGSRAVGLEKVVKYIAEKVTQSRSGSEMAEAR
ncbi:MAG: UDP-N-acetylmuramoyl-tripeptide--D-alanyl-D-alanine ligase [Planctomycetes bacterium]|nr:UDP-N-acetylmuramoyl-tripeptide--D-alanyl-D-alanine ligase [Planctomycetota bacterium]